MICQVLIWISGCGQRLIAYLPDWDYERVLGVSIIDEELSAAALLLRKNACKVIIGGAIFQ